MSPTVESLQSKVEEAAKVVEQIVKISPAEYIWKRLATLGIYQDAESHELLLSKDCTEGEARRVFCENGEPNLPPVRFKRMWSILKGAGTTEEQKEPNLAEVIAELKPIGQWNDQRLLEAYNSTCETGIITELTARSNDRPFIVFLNEAEGVVDIATSNLLLREARRRITPSQFKVGNTLKRVYKAGEFPSLVLTECPFHSHVLLFDGFCDECGQSWKGVSYEAMQFARIVAELSEQPSDSPSLTRFLKSAKEGTMQDDYPKVKLEFDERQEDNKLPNLKRRTATHGGVSDPFHCNKR